MSGKKWVKIMLRSCIVILALIGGGVAFVDPWFHYHKPWKNFYYILHDERYMNDGIAKNFEYEALLTGTSMTENFKTSEIERLFGVTAVKLPFSGGSYKEVNSIVETALKKSDNDIKLVIRGLDNSMMLQPADAMRYEETTYPSYLYNDRILDDVEYLLNKKVVIESIIPDTLKLLRHKEGGITSFDDYANWNKFYKFGKETVEANYNRLNKADKMKPFTGSDRDMLKDNIKKNVTKIADEYPDIQFYYFITPYSFLYWDSLIQSGEFYRTLEAEQLAIQEILNHPNIKLFSFNNRFSMTCNLDNYKDVVHYGEWVNSKILQWMENGDYQLSKENYEEYLKQVKDYYENYNFDMYFQ